MAFWLAWAGWEGASLVTHLRCSAEAAASASGAEASASARRLGKALRFEEQAALELREKLKSEAEENEVVRGRLGVLEVFGKRGEDQMLIVW